MAATGEAAGFAASKAIKNDLAPKDIDGKEIKAFMLEKGYEI